MLRDETAERGRQRYLEKQREDGKRRREDRKSRHVCVQCQAQDDRTLSGKTLCADCAAKNQADMAARRERRKSEHLCVRCGKQTPETLAGAVMCADCAQSAKENMFSRCKRCYKPMPEGDTHTRCPECREYAKIAYRERKSKAAANGTQEVKKAARARVERDPFEVKKRQRESAQARRADRKARHVCVKCQTQDDRTLAGKTLCEKCAGIQNAALADIYSRRRAERQCAHCGKTLPDGYYYVECPECRAYESEMKRKRRAREKEEDALWLVKG